MPVPQNCEPRANPHSAVPKPLLERADLENADRGGHAVRHDREAGVVAGLTFAVRPDDEALEAFDRRRRR